jgi:NADPH-dependent curcumin reductase CurA
MRQPATPPGSGPQAEDLGMSVPSHADVIVLNRRPGPSLRPGDLVPERWPLRASGPGEVVVRNVVTSVDPYQLRMLRGSSEVAPVAIGEPVPANSVGMVVRSEDPGVPVGAQVATCTGWQTPAGSGQRVQGPRARARGPRHGFRPRLTPYRQAGRPDLGG